MSDPLETVRVAWAEVGTGAPRREIAWSLIRDLVPGAVVSNPCRRCGGPHGPVRVEGAETVASVSYAGGLALVAVADAAAARALGVDAEAAEPSARAQRRTASATRRCARRPDGGSPVSSAAVHHTVSAAGLDGVLGSGATLRDWVRVEAVLKADGRGLRVDPADVRVDPCPAAEGGWLAVIADRRIGGTATAGPATTPRRSERPADSGVGFAGRDVAGPTGVLVSVAVLPRRGGLSQPR